MSDRPHQELLTRCAALRVRGLVSVQPAPVFVCEQPSQTLGRDDLRVAAELEEIRLCLKWRAVERILPVVQAVVHRRPFPRCGA